jgi:pilus assembly protein Flp/PilA
MTKTLLATVRQFTKDESGATAIEYGLIAAGIAVVIIGALALAGDALTNMFNTITAALGG